MYLHPLPEILTTRHIPLAGIKTTNIPQSSITHIHKNIDNLVLTFLVVQVEKLIPTPHVIKNLVLFLVTKLH